MKWFLLLLQFLIIPAFAQTTTHLTGTILDHKKEPLPDVTVRVSNSILNAKTDTKGQFSLFVPSTGIEISVTKAGFRELHLHLNLQGASEYIQDVVLYPENFQLQEVRVMAEQANVITLDPTKTEFIPSVNGNFESILKNLPGVSTNNELTSQYSVRGGNFDENLIYINDIEFYRPFLVRNGQSEGLSFINPDLVGKVRFSAGGFDARYGDKMSSVLDVAYSKPDSSVYTVSPGLLGSSASAKYISRSRSSYLLAGVRQKSNRTLLKSQNTQGGYAPEFYDMQLLYNLDINKRHSLSYFGNFNSSQFTLTPVTSETSFGTAADQFHLEVFFDGREKSTFETWMNAITWVFKPSEQFLFKWIASTTRIRESEDFNLIGQYLFVKPGTVAHPSQKLENKGVGSDVRSGNNVFQAGVWTSEAKVYFQKGRSFLEGGLKYQFHRVQDVLQEHSRIDSLSYGSTVSLTSFTETLAAVNKISTNTLSGYIQNSIKVTDNINLSGGIRVNYSSRNSEVLISPRFNLSYAPKGFEGQLYRFSAGIYSQPAFYREMRYREGSLNQDQRAQRSFHLLAGMDKQFRGARPLRFVSEVYYKGLIHLVPYKIDNLKIQYLPGQKARGYAAGLDLNLSGEFVKDLESSFRLSVMKTAEDIDGDFFFKNDPSGNQNRVEPGFLKRPTDQRLNLSVFFQDKLFNSPEYKVHLNLLYGSALPVGPPQRERYEDIFFIPAYKRADIGFSKDLITKNTTNGLKTRYFKSLVLYAGVFNLFGNRNTISYLWLSDINNNQFAIPNHLTGRILNLRLIGRIM